MDIVDQCFHNRLTSTLTRLARSDRVTEFALDHRVHGLALPALAIDAIQACGRDRFPALSAYTTMRSAIAPHRWNQITGSHLPSIQARIAEQEPGRTPVSRTPIAVRLPSQGVQQGAVSSWTDALHRTQKELR